MKQVLSSSNGFVKPFELIAVMGPSGCGKTSLLNILANRI
jgi:ABC-type lipoprotein export system ATPase subunit